MSHSENKRNPGIDLLRILGMYAIIVHHILFFGKVFSKYKNYYKELEFINILSFWHVSSFGLISGIIGYKTNKKYSNLLYLWFCSVTYSIGIHLFYKIFYPNLIKNQKILHHLFPIIFRKYWYFTSYFGMYLFLPLINKGISISNKIELKAVIMSTIGIFIFWKDYIVINKDPFKINSGYSVLGLLLFYLIGAYLGKYIINQNENKNLIFYLFCLSQFIFSSYLCYYFSFYNTPKIFIIIKLKIIFIRRINSIAMIIQVIYFLK